MGRGQLALLQHRQEAPLGTVPDTPPCARLRAPLSFSPTPALHPISPGRRYHLAEATVGHRVGSQQGLQAEAPPPAQSSPRGAGRAFTSTCCYQAPGWPLPWVLGPLEGTLAGLGPPGTHPSDEETFLRHASEAPLGPPARPSPPQLRAVRVSSSSRPPRGGPALPCTGCDREHITV